MWIFAAAMALIVQADEWLAMPMPDGFVTVHKQSAQRGSIEERVPKGETVDQWTRMITLITLNTGMSSNAYAAAFNERLKQGCPGARSTELAYRVAGRPALVTRLDCPLNPNTGKPEILFYRVIGANGHLYMEQVAFRYMPGNGEVTWAKERIDSALLCTSRATDPVCKR